MPEVKIISCEMIKPGAKSTLLLKLSNPTGHEMALKLLPAPAPAEQTETEDKDDASIEKSLEKSLKLDKVRL